ncbi:acyl-CoA dehydrogenase family protein [Pseudomonas sp. 5P_5.1_Bac1]|uniref:acyl-CoA dehydrogenase family protein n=1 Tax=Pseudomonas sp. 5P_5.1_Bac1 TaxID=2971616 RepID=UPI0021C655BB|nr:acyl-CoA dehydrogenase family protein [Pseudomonas sp. 5P_5.1_Bac1]MCU1723582.1 acyl-CoA dehydrogenase family protein [Pseudomonas sp. 5P_5.1_Bac1]
MTTASPETTPLAHRVRHFVEQHILPRELELGACDKAASALAAELQAKAQAAGVFGNFYPFALGGRVVSLVEYLTVATEEGRSEFAPAILGCDATLDAYMLDRHANPELRERFLMPLVRGEQVPCYAMSEPESIGSIPATMTSRADWHGDHWRLNGRKWFICRAERADFATVIARTGDGPTGEALSMLVVPSDSPGFRFVRPLALLGRQQGQGELRFDDVRVTPNQVLGTPGQGIALMQRRLGLGRLLRAAHWLGLAQRCFDDLCARVHSPRGHMARLADKQLLRGRVYQVYRDIASARALLQDAAAKFDQGQANSIEVNLAKLAASEALSGAVDSAMQVMGAEGLSELSPLSGIYRHARTTHILDGTDDALISTLGRDLLAATAPGKPFDSRCPSLHLDKGTP